MFAGVLAARHAEAKFKVKTLEQFVSEIMSLDHPEVFYWRVSDHELNTGQTDRKKVSEAEHETETEDRSF